MPQGADNLLYYYDTTQELNFHPLFPYFNTTQKSSDSTSIVDTSCKAQKYYQEVSGFDNLLETSNFDQIQTKTTINNDWLVFVILIGISIFSVVQTFFYKRMQQMYKVIVKPSHLSQIERDGNLLSEFIQIPLNVIQHLIIPLFIYQTAVHFEVISSQRGLLLYAIFVGVYVLINLIRHLAIHLWGIIFSTQNLSRIHRLLLTIYNQITAILIIPISLCFIIWQSSIFIKIGFLIIATLLIIRVIRLFYMSFFQEMHQLFYLIVYFCTLEIIPILVIIKLIYIYCII
ncbi:MAG: DUF4271 domain-containing protein [Bacteroidales bacterium]|jgi:hypothetical protein